MDERQEHGAVASSIPGRLRVRIHRHTREPHLMHRVRAHLEQQPGINQVEINRSTGSVMVRYSPSEQSSDTVLAMLRDIGVIVRDIAQAAGEELPDVGRSTTSVSVIEAFDDLDRRISRLTGRRVDLKLLFPLGLGAIGLRQAFRQGLGLAQVPAYVLLWYAFDSFWKFHREPPRPLVRGRRGARRRASGAREAESGVVSHDA